jgi:alanine racemase
MDLMAFDITGCDARTGEMVELLGPNAPLNDVAAASGTAAYECLVRLGGRGRRVYLETAAGGAGGSPPARAQR